MKIVITQISSRNAYNTLSLFITRKNLIPILADIVSENDDYLCVVISGIPSSLYMFLKEELSYEWFTGKACDYIRID